MASITQEEAAEMFGVPVVVLYVCDGKRDCSKPGCLDHSEPCCHHTADPSHALYGEHDGFESCPTTRGGEAVILRVERIHG